MATVRDISGTQKLRAIFQRIREEAPVALEETGKAMALQAAARAPSQDEEYMTLLWGDGNPGNFSGMPDFTSRSDGDGRIRLEKEDNEYLINFIPTSFMVQGLSVGVGDKQELNIISQYAWRNIDGQYRFETKYPLWQAWENGGTFHIEPLESKADGGRYPLQPSTNLEENRGLFAMDKSIPRKAMYSGVDIAEVVDQVLLPAIKKIVSQA